MMVCDPCRASTELGEGPDSDRVYPVQRISRRHSQALVVLGELPHLMQ